MSIIGNVLGVTAVGIAGVFLFTYYALVLAPGSPAANAREAEQRRLERKFNTQQQPDFKIN